MALKRVFEKYNKTMDSDMSRMDARVFGKVLRYVMEKVAKHETSTSLHSMLPSCSNHLTTNSMWCNLHFHMPVICCTVRRDTRLVTIGDKTGKIFNKVRPSSESSINFIQFIEALRHVALENRVSLNEVFEIIVACGGPKSQK